MYVGVWGCGCVAIWMVATESWSPSGGEVPTRLRRVARKRQEIAAVHGRVREWLCHSIGRRVVAASVLPRRMRGACSYSYSYTCSYTPIRDSRQDSSVRVGVRVRQTRNSTTHTLPRPHTLSACPRRPIAGSGGNYHLNLPSHFGCKVARILLTIQAKFSNITPRHERSQGQRERQAKAGFETGS